MKKYCTCNAIAAVLTLAVMLIVGCGDSVSSSYATRAEAEADQLFERGWLPEIIPVSSKEIVMTNDLDHNISNGEFRFDAVDYDEFVGHLKRVPEKDKDGSSAYTFEDWIFWIGSDKSNCRFYMRLRR